ncbi:MAG: O-antigen ligase family protein [Bacteroidota bacterium]
MKSIFFIKDTVANKIAYYHLLAFLVCLPFERLYSELALVSFLLHTIIHLSKEAVLSIRRPRILLAVSVYLLTCIGTLYTHYRDEAFSEWERQLAILLFPLLFSVTSFDFVKYRFNLLKGLALSCTLTILYLYANAIYIIQYNHLSIRALFSTAFLNHNFAEPIDMHATYFSMYIALSVSALIYLVVNAESKRGRLLYTIGLMILFAGLLQLSSRAVFIALLININIVVPFFLLTKRKILVFIAISLGVSVIMIAGLLRNDVFKERYVTEFKTDLTQQSINLNILEPRAVRWGCAWELIKEAPLAGHGSGSEIVLLKEKYYARHYYNAYINELNAHNQFLSFLIKTGIPGFLIFLLVLVAGFAQAIRTKNMIYCSFLVIITIVSFSENILDANKGIFFFAFFYRFFYLASGKKEQAVIQK